MRLPTLYSRDSHGDIRSWTVTVEFDNAFFAVSHYGLIGGTQQESKKHCMIGSNFATNALEAQSFILSMWERQKKKGYTENKDGEPEGIAPRPMLAKLFEKEKHKIEYPVAVQPKLDGFRCISIMKDGIISCWSRSGLRFETTKAIEDQLHAVMKEGDIYDGELYKHRTDFNLLSGQIRNVSSDKSEAQYHIYDYINTSMSQAVRLDKVRTLQVEDDSLIQIVPTIIAVSEQGVYELTNEFIGAGYEGAIVRAVFGLYRPKYRSGELLKVKNFVEEDFKIIDFYEGEGKAEGAVIWECITPEGEVFAAVPKGTYVQRRKWFDEGKDYLGKYLTVRYPKNVGGKNESGKPRHGVGIRIREDME